ncbi:MAG: TRAP transporter TatT component family protein [Bacteroidota bacterium]
MMTTKYLSFLLLALVLQGCVQILAIRTMGGIMDYGFEAFNEESDLQLAQEGMGSNLKLLEALIKGDPENKKFLLLASQGYSAYALAFVEDDSVERARIFYLRGRDFAQRVLHQNARLREAWDKDLDSFRASLNTLSREDVPAVFWTAFGWGSYINVTRHDVSALADLAKVTSMMRFVLEKDPTYYFGGAYLFLGSIEAVTPTMLGGKPEKAKEYFEKAIAASDGKFLMTYVFYAKTYAAQQLEQDLFESLLTKVDDAPLDILPEARLPNAVAKRKARLLRDKIAELF